MKNEKAFTGVLDFDWKEINVHSVVKHRFSDTIYYVGQDGDEFYLIVVYPKDKNLVFDLKSTGLDGRNKNLEVING